MQPLWRTVWKFFKKLEIKLPRDPTIPLMGIYTKKTIIKKDTCTPMFIAALGTVDKTASKQGIKLLVICNCKGLKISKQSKNQLSKPSSMLAYK